jgi:putative transposase
VTQNTSLRRDDEVAAGRLAETFSTETIDALIKDAKTSGTPLDGVGGLLSQMTKAVLERALQGEMADHLGYDSGDPAGHGSGNSRNGKTKKTVATANGPIEIDVPRDRNGSFEPVIAGETCSSDRQYRRHDPVVVFTRNDDTGYRSALA